ncbi:MAG: M42 family peptidase [Planctomycetota bacterium]|jgi:endoglucanase|nr:M42 family peptidase [Planctomycetota bacterium]MDP7133098.1 M42 family peptidase [Planctomycetota bacterium]MDP7253278.1 M42 family peptidase [Planctomycetota bacterium]
MNLKLLETVCNTPGIPGFEDPIQAVVTGCLKKACNEVHTDRMGNVIGRKKSKLRGRKGKEPVRVILAAHADEIGMIARHIDGQGYIHVNAVGGLNAINIVSQRVIIHGRKQIQGVIAPGAGSQGKAPEIKELRIDTGLPPKEVKKLVEPGDPISFAQEFVHLNKKVLMARNFDDRMGTFCLLEAMSRVGPTEAEIYAVSTTQEEVGTRGIETAAYVIQPDVGLAIDGSMPNGAHGDRTERTCEMGEGAGIYLIDGLTIGSPKLIELLFALGKKYKIPCQKNIGGGTDAHKIQRMGRGCLCTTVGVPTRYMHSTVQLCHEDDVEATIQLLVRFMEHAHELGGVCR